MSQILDSKQFGKLEFVRTWAMNGGLHIGRMPNGAYAHISGLAIKSRAELSPITDPEELARAEVWLEQRNRPPDPSQAPVRKLYFEAEDESWRYLDNGAVAECVEDLMGALKGPVLTTALVWFQRRHTEGTVSAPPPLVPPDQQVLDLLRERPGLNPHEIETALGFEARGTVEVLALLRKAGHVSVDGKKFYVAIPVG
mgnify:CR=1 FL=1